MMRTEINQSGFGQWIILLVLMLGIGVGVWVAQVRTNLVPQAATPAPEIRQQAVMSLKLEEGEVLQQNKPFKLGVYLRSDLDAVRLISSQLKYDATMLELMKIETPAVASTSAAFYASEPAQLKKMEVSQWLETLFDNKEGKASITGLFAKGDFKTKLEEKLPFNYVKLLFKPLKSGITELKIDDSSVMLRSADNQDILVKKDNLKLEVMPASESGVKKGK